MQGDLQVVDCHEFSFVLNGPGSSRHTVLDHTAMLIPG
jgi:hypothetical protein